MSPSSPFHYLILPITYPLNLISTLLPIFPRDLSVSMANLVIGRLLPTLSYQPSDLTSKTAIVTGANSGIGLQLATDLASQGASVILACRDLGRGQKAKESIYEQVPGAVGRVTVMELDTSRCESVRGFVENWKGREDSDRTVDILCLNAGIATAPDRPGGDLSEDGLEIIYATNVLGGFLLTGLLEPYLARDGRVVVTSSTGQYSAIPQVFSKFSTDEVKGRVEVGFHAPLKKVKGPGSERGDLSGQARYSISKSMQCAMVKTLQRRWDRDISGGAETGVGMGDETRSRGRTAHAFTPGFTSTPIFGKMSSNLWSNEPVFAFLKVTTALATNVSQGAMTGSWLASTNDERVVGIGNGGGYWDRMQRRMCSADLYDDGLLERLWTRWENDAGFQWK